MRVIDSHQHFWSLSTPGHEWPTAQEGPIFRDFGPGDLAAEVTGVEIAGTVLVQSQPTDTDTDWMLALARENSIVAAVVGWVDLAAPNAPARIETLARDPNLRSLRPMLQSIPDTDWLLREAVAPALDAMIANGLRLDALVQPRHLTMLARLAERRPDLPIVIDHAAKPHADKGILDPWRADIAGLADRGFYCKLSGLRTEQAAGQSADALMPYIEHLVASFGDRLMWGSDWPVVRLSGDDWRRWLDDSARMAARAGADADRLFAGAATEFYALECNDAA
ncbi:MAG: amidohydrolase family protein [Sphingomonas sp.]|nr:amidohydrolase family protein [Sphingomonas sp.]